MPDFGVPLANIALFPDTPPLVAVDADAVVVLVLAKIFSLSSFFRKGVLQTPSIEERARKKFGVGVKSAANDI